MKKYLFILTFFFLFFQAIHAQTNVTGGLFSNTTWTKANSPYIVTGNVVVFPGITLTIEPGVTIKFNDGLKMEVREGSLFANGTAANPITFTSNSSNPQKGSWDQIFVNQSANIQIKHCKFHYAKSALTGQSIIISVVSSLFTDNTLGMDAQSNTNTRIDSCTFRNNGTGQSLTGSKISITNCSYIKNSTGLYSQSSNVINCILDSNSVYGLLKHMACNDTIRNNKIRYNGNGIGNDISGCGGTLFIYDNVIEYNSVGIWLELIGGSQDINVHNNIICSNTLYNFKNLSMLTINATNNCWCSKSSSYVESTIYDAHDDVNYGLVNYDPINILLCPMFVGIKDVEQESLKSYQLYPDPFKNKALLKFENPKKENHTLLIYDSYGKCVRRISAHTSDTIELERQELASGIFFFQLQSQAGIIARGKFIID